MSEPLNSNLSFADLDIIMEKKQKYLYLKKHLEDIRGYSERTVVHYAARQASFHVEIPKEDIISSLQHQLNCIKCYLEDKFITCPDIY